MGAFQITNLFLHSPSSSNALPHHILTGTIHPETPVHINNWMTVYSTKPRPRLCFIIFLTLAIFLLSSSALPLHSATAVNCVPANFETVFSFFLTNYAVHAATVPSIAGGCMAVSALWTIGSLFYPFAGLMRSIILVLFHLLAKDNVGKAISQGAVVVATRSEDWVPHTDDELVYVGLAEGSKFPENRDR
jgi:hypothetical protein